MKTVTFLFLISFAHLVFGGETSRLSEVLIHSRSLEGNLLGDPAKRHVAVYLPPSYYVDHERRYPVVYVLHGNRRPASKAPRNILGIFGEPTLDLMDALIAEGRVKEMIVVQPDGRHRYGGCQYANSSVSGNWADFVVKDLVTYIDDNFRTLPKPESRGLIGSSMGGRGVLDLALKFPGVYGTVYAMFPGQMGFQRFDRDNDAEAWRKLILAEDPNTSERGLPRLLGFAVAFSPNPDSPPYFADFPMRVNGKTMEFNKEVQQQWAKFDPVEIAAKSADSLLELKALYFDCGTSDQGLEAVRLFSSILKKQNIPHEYDEYDGGHGDPGAVRFRSRVLPSVSVHLAVK
jgi:S-formylglutathione hydrolase